MCQSHPPSSLHLLSWIDHVLLPPSIYLFLSHQLIASLHPHTDSSSLALMGSWVRTITTPFRKACTLIRPPSDHNKPQPAGHNDRHRMALHGEVMACSYHDVQVMWSILDKSSPGGGERSLRR
ncbi:hypothetical protein Cni_G25193 [Canna indica]|uniref:Uncharacterized protein n=1 Tax=Canna indica TaxID=4628 RepID=A0AAQ3L1G3_9LILI|nr:hypothetical protein Cni_G25193 [Canna indica]